MGRDLSINQLLTLINQLGLSGIVAERSRASTFFVSSKPFGVDGIGFESRQGMANEISTVLFVFIRD